MLKFRVTDVFLNVSVMSGDVRLVKSVKAEVLQLKRKSSTSKAESISHITISVKTDFFVLRIKCIFVELVCIKISIF